MDSHQYLKKFGKRAAEEVAKKAGTTMGHYYQIAFGYRKPSRALACKLVDASEGVLDLDSLLYSERKRTYSHGDKSKSNCDSHNEMVRKIKQVRLEQQAADADNPV